MDRVNAILQNSRFRAYMEQLEELEADRIYCHHGIDHLLDVARIAVIMADDETITIDREIIYAAALVHDIGRGRQYEDGTEHELASAAIAPFILEESGFTEEEIDTIVEAVINHGNEAVMMQKDLTGILYRADKASRKCFACKAIDGCHKPERKRVMDIRY